MRTLCYAVMGRLETLLFSGSEFEKALAGGKIHGFMDEMAGY